MEEIVEVKNPWLLKFKYRTNDNRHAFKKNAYKARSNAKRVTYPVTSPGRPGYNWHEKVKKS